MFRAHCFEAFSFFENRIGILSRRSGDEQIATLGLELEKRDCELKRRRQEAMEHAEQMKVEWYDMKLGPMTFIPSMVTQAGRKDAGKMVTILSFYFCSL